MTTKELVDFCNEQTMSYCDRCEQTKACDEYTRRFRTTPLLMDKPNIRKIYHKPDCVYCSKLEL